MQIVLRTATPEGIRVVLPAVVYAKVLEEHAAVADLELIFRHEPGVWVLAVVEFGEVPAIIVTVFSADHQPI